MTDIIETEKIEMYGVLCIDSEFPEGSICKVNTSYSGVDILTATKKECKDFIKSISKQYPNTVYKIFKMKFKEKK